MADVGHAEVEGGAADGESAHGLQLLRGGGHGGLDRGDLTEPALIFGFLEPVAEVGMDLFQPRNLSWVNAEERASDAPLTELTTMFQQFIAGFRLPALICPRDRIG